MSVQLTANLREIVDRLVSTGAFESEEAVVRHAIESLDRRIEERDAVRAGVEEMRAGRVRSHGEVMDQMERNHPSPSQQ